MLFSRHIEHIGILNETSQLISAYLIKHETGNLEQFAKKIFFAVMQFNDSSKVLLPI